MPTGLSRSVGLTTLFKFACTILGNREEEWFYMMRIFNAEKCLKPKAQGNTLGNIVAEKLFPVDVL